MPLVVRDPARPARSRARPVLSDDEFERASEEILAIVGGGDLVLEPVARLAPCRFAGATRVLSVGIGGGGDVVGALATAEHARTLGAVGRRRRPHVGAPADRPDPRAAPARRDHRRRACSTRPSRCAGPETVRARRRPVRRVAHGALPRRADRARRPEPGPGARSPPGWPTPRARLGCDAIALVDVGGDVLAHGDEPGLASPLADAVLLAAARHLATRPARRRRRVRRRLRRRADARRGARAHRRGRRARRLARHARARRPRRVERLEAAIARSPTEASAMALRCARGAPRHDDDPPRAAARVAALARRRADLLPRPARRDGDRRAAGRRGRRRADRCATPTRSCTGSACAPSSTTRSRRAARARGSRAVSWVETASEHFVARHAERGRRGRAARCCGCSRTRGRGWPSGSRRCPSARSRSSCTTRPRSSTSPSRCCRSSSAADHARRRGATSSGWFGPRRDPRARARARCEERASARRRGRARCCCSRPPRSTRGSSVGERTRGCAAVAAARLRAARGRGCVGRGAVLLAARRAHARPAIARRLREGPPPAFPPALRDAHLLGGTRRRPARARGGRQTRSRWPRGGGRRRQPADEALERAFHGRPLHHTEGTWRAHLARLGGRPAPSLRPRPPRRTGGRPRPPRQPRARLPGRAPGAARGTGRA